MLRKYFRASPISYAFFGAIVGCFFIGASPIFVRLSLIDPFATGFFRFFLALPFLWVWTIHESVSSPLLTYPSTVKEYFLLGAAGLFFALDIAIWHLSLKHTSVMNSILLNNMTPIFVSLFAWFILKEKISGMKLLGVIMAVIGTSILVLGQNKMSEIKVYGDSLALLSAIFFSGYVLTVKHLRMRFTAPSIMAWSSMSCMYFLAFFSFWQEDHIIPQTFEAWAPLFGLALIVHFLGQGLVASTIRYLSASLSSLTMMMTPLVSSLMGYFIFDETLTGLKMGGALIILVGIVIARQNEKSMNVTGVL